MYRLTLNLEAHKVPTLEVAYHLIDERATDLQAKVDVAESTIRTEVKRFALVDTAAPGLSDTAPASLP
jgi:hypothetical protein